MSDLRNLLAAATPLPWRKSRPSLDADHPESLTPACWGIAAGKETWHRNMGHFHPADARYSMDEIDVVAIGYDRDYHTPEAAIDREADADLIVAAVNSLPALLDVVEAAKHYREVASAAGSERDMRDLNEAKVALFEALARLVDRAAG